jgi:electron transport complex protein RnfD
MIPEGKQENMKNPLIVTSSPHLHSGMTTRRLMLDVLIALLPAAAASVWLFGLRAVLVILTCVAACVGLEALCRVILKRSQTVGDLSAAVTGVLLAFNLPSGIPLWQAVIGSAAAIVVAKQMFGGIGQNFVNPALAGRIVLLASFPESMNTWPAPLPAGGADAASMATPLAALADGSGIQNTLSDLFLGLRPGSLGETSALALLLGGLYLIARRVISPIIPISCLGTVALCALISGQPPLFHLLSGGLILGAFFMATDYTTSPVSRAGKLVFGIGCGLLTMLIRLFGSLPEGISFAIVIMNILVPLIERATRPLPFGAKRRWRHE